jgi:rhodanese-related sulfurtransferase
MKLFSKLVLAGILAVSSAVAYNPLDGVKAQKAEALKYVKKYVTANELKQWMKNDKDFQIVDVREKSEMIAGQIDFIETIDLPRGVLYGGVKKGALKPNKTYVMVCRTGHRALLAAATLNKYYHFKNVYVLKGGIKAWIKSGGVITNGLHLGPVKIKLEK